VQEPLLPTDLQHIKSVLGPFQVIPVLANSPTPETNYPAILVLNQNGSTEASKSWTVGFDTDLWARDTASKVRSVSVELGYATIGSDIGRTFVVKVAQPFVFEEMPEKVYAVDSSGVVWTVTSARAEAMRLPIN
jgi:hypothetical protein